MTNLGRILLTGRGTTLQGSGALSGTRQWFVRMAGCSIRTCPIRAICDERFSLRAINGSWHQIKDLINEALAEVGKGGWLHVTGGEPADAPDELGELLQAARTAGLRTHVQTAGLRGVHDADFITVSPKAPADEIAITNGGELIVIFDDQPLDDLRAYERLGFAHYFLQPKWIDGGEANALETASAVLDLGGKWRMTLQAHKHIGIK